MKPNQPRRYSAIRHNECEQENDYSNHQFHVIAPNGARDKPSGSTALRAGGPILQTRAPFAGAFAYLELSLPLSFAYLEGLPSPGAQRRRT